jgi:enoyl-CoA hydratase/carnithine racemase
MSAPSTNVATSAATSAVTVEIGADHVALVTINRPEARNAINSEVAAGLEAAIDQTEANPDIWAVIITGTGTQAFCAGADLKEISAGRGAGLRTERGGFAGFVNAPRTKPWIAAVNGPALAGGCEIVLTCELVVAAEGAVFGLPEVKRGLMAVAGGLYRLPRVLPRPLALECILTGEPITAEHAHQFGMVNRLVPAARVVAEARALAARITANAPLAVRGSLAVAKQSLDMTDAELQALSQEAMGPVAASEDYQEGPRAFIEKRAPRWTGR